MNKFKIFSVLLFIILIFIYQNFGYENLTNIPIAFSLNDNYVYPLIVLLTSILYNSSQNVFYIFYLLLSPDIKKKNIHKILGLKAKYQKCKIKLLYMGEKYSNFYGGVYNTTAIYYRLELSNLITDVDKIIYLDVDNIVHKDLTEFYNINMGKYYYLGFPGHDLVKFSFNGTRNFINSGVMLINLKKLREINATKLFKDFYQKFGTRKYDEYILNGVFYDKIGFLPLKYGIPDFNKNNSKLRSPSYFVSIFKKLINFTEKDMEVASKNRVISHGCYDLKKWWNKKYEDLTAIGKECLYYASKSHVFGEICDKYKQFKQYCKKIKKKN